MADEPSDDGPPATVKTEKDPLKDSKNDPNSDDFEWKRRDAAAVAFIITLFFFAGAVYSLPSAFYSPFVVNDRKGDVIEVSLVLASFDVSNVIVSILYPYIMLGLNSKTLFHCGVLVLWVSNIMFGCIMELDMDQTIFVVFSVLIRLVMGAATALLCCSGTDLIACNTPHKLSVGFITWAISATWLGDMIGPLVGGLLEAAIDNFFVPFVIISALVVFCQMIVCCTTRKQLMRDKIGTLLISLSTWYSFLFRFEIIMVVMATFIIALGMGALEVDLALYLKDEFFMGEATIALIFGLMPVMFAIVSPVTSFLNKPPYPLTMLACSVLFLCPGYGFLASGTNFDIDSKDAETAVLIICVCLIGIGVALGKK